MIIFVHKKTLKEVVSYVKETYQEMYAKASILPIHAFNRYFCFVFLGDGKTLT